jgi:hypothetical protein
MTEEEVRTRKKMRAAYGAAAGVVVAMLLKSESVGVRLESHSGESPGETKWYHNIEYAELSAEDKLLVWWAPTLAGLLLDGRTERPDAALNLALRKKTELSESEAFDLAELLDGFPFLKRSVEVLTKHWEAIVRIADRLVEVESLSGRCVWRLFSGEPLVPEINAAGESD